jgi:ADP-dependent NAD(P)H-hydrate dehydratase / NAD(P)H-hydrate epimerase
MRPLLTPEQMSEADSATIDSGTPAHVLMDRAGRAVAREVIRTVGGRYGTNVVVVCGKGNNGGDGFVAARVLAREGCKVLCTDAGTPYEASGAALHHLEVLRRSGIELRPFDASLLDEADVVVDAIFGTGFRGEAEGATAKTIDAINSCGAIVISVDIPSGVNGETGAVDGIAVNADRTVAIAAEKLGSALAPGAANAGAVTVVDVGIKVPDGDVNVVEARDVALRLPHRSAAGHKRSNGSVAVLAGSTGMSGAALLCSRAAMRTGAGYVTLGSTVEVIEAANIALPEVLKRALWDGNGMSAVALERFGDVLERADALALGPGLRDRPAQRTLVEAGLGSLDLPVVLDADGLNVLNEDVSPLRNRQRPTVITPHPGELSRLTGLPVGDIQRDRLGSARRAAVDLSCIVLLKGFRTVVAAPNGEAVVTATGGPELATAGTGDVLSGILATFLAQGLEPFDAAWVAAHVHGLAGSVAGQAAGGRGVVATDVAEAIPDALALLAPSA